MESIEKELFGIEKKEQAINSKIKGNRFELVVAKMLSAWTGEEFHRIPQSGGLRWRNTANICGDILCTNTKFDFPFVVEAKHYKYIEFRILLRKNSKIYTFWRQVSRDAKKAKKWPILIVKTNYQRPMIFIGQDLYEIITSLMFNYLKPKCYGNEFFGYDTSVFFKFLNCQGFIRNLRRFKKEYIPV